MYILYYATVIRKLKITLLISKEMRVLYVSLVFSVWFYF